MSDTTRDPFAPKRQSPVPERPYITSSPLAPWNKDLNKAEERTASPELNAQERRTAAEPNSWPQAVPQPPQPRLDGKRSSLFVRVLLVIMFAGVVASGMIFAKPISQAVSALFDPEQPSKSPGLITANILPSNESAIPKTQDAPPPSLAVPPPVVATVAQAASTPVPPPATKIAQAQPTSVQQSVVPPAAQPVLPIPAPTTNSAAPSVSAQTQAPPVLPPQGNIRAPVRGVTDTEIRFGISAPFSGAAKELGQNMKLGIEAAFNSVNDRGGVHGRKLRLIAADDGYEPARTTETMKSLFEKDQVFGIVGNVGTPTAVVAVPYALQHKMLFFGAFTGAGLLRNDPPDRYVFNYRASYAEETAAVVQYLVKVKRLKPTQIAVFAQQDAYGEAGWAGVAKAVRALGGDENAILRLYYQRNTVEVDAAVAELKAHNITKGKAPIKAVIMVPTYRAAARFIEKTHDLYPSMIYTSVSFVGSTALANELMLLGSKYANGIIVTQVVPAVDGYSSLALEYKSALAKYFPGEAPDYVSLEGYVMARVLIAALQNNGPDLDTEKLVQTLENLHDYDIGLGTPVSFGRSEHQGVHKVWGSQLDARGHYQAIDLQ
jgi:branched-chain amino acid transport system substrate-binding protein